MSQIVLYLWDIKEAVGLHLIPNYRLIGRNAQRWVREAWPGQSEKS